MQKNEEVKNITLIDEYNVIVLPNAGPIAIPILKQIPCKPNASPQRSRGIISAM